MVQYYLSFWFKVVQLISLLFHGQTQYPVRSTRLKLFKTLGNVNTELEADHDLMLFRRRRRKIMTSGGYIYNINTVAPVSSTPPSQSYRVLR